MVEIKQSEKVISIKFDKKPSKSNHSWLSQNGFKRTLLNRRNGILLYEASYSESVMKKAEKYFKAKIHIEEPDNRKPSDFIDEKTFYSTMIKRLVNKHGLDKTNRIKMREQILLGIQIEKEHTEDRAKLLKIIYEHLWESPAYYTEAKPENWAAKEIKKEKPAKLKEPWQMTPTEYAGATGIDEIAIAKAAHPQHVKDAIAAGKTIPLNVLEYYKHNYWAAKEIEKEKNSTSSRPGFMTDYKEYPLIKGRDITISMPNGEKHKAVFAIVELDNIIASHDEENFHSSLEYPKNAAGNNINDRNYKDDQSAQKAVMDYARNLEPERLITTSRTPSGTPIVSKDGFVVSGNNRTMSLKLAVNQHPDNYKKYLSFLAEEIEAFGFKNYLGTSLLMNDSIPIEGSSFDEPKSVKFNHPALVRIDLDFSEYTTQELAKYNKDTKKAERPVDKAIKLSNILQENSRCAEIIADTTGEYETFSEFYSNSASQKKLSKTLVECNILTEQELPAYFSDATFTEAGKEFIENLLAALILNREALIAAEEPGVKSIRQKLITALPVLMKNAGLPEGSLKTYINGAVILQQNIKGSGSSFADFIRSHTLYGEGYDRKTVYLNRLINEGKLKFKAAIEGYNDSISKNQGSMLFDDKMDPDQIFEHWIVKAIDPTQARLIENSDIVKGKSSAKTEKIMHPYIAIYKDKRHELYAESIYQAQLQAAEFFKAKKSYEVQVYIADDSDDKKSEIIEKKTPEVKETEHTIVIEWSEGFSEENIPIKDMDELQSKLIIAGKTENPKETYIKNKVLFNGKPYRIDSGEVKGDFDYEKENISDYLKKTYPNQDWTIFESDKKESTREEVVKDIDTETEEIIEIIEEPAGATEVDITIEYKNAFELNKAIEKLLDSKWNTPFDQWTVEEKEFLKGYSGYGGLDEYGEISLGSLFEYYTDDPVIEKMWGLAYKYGYTNGRVLEPSIGIGRFFDRRYISNLVAKDGYEINKYSAKICTLLFPEANINNGEETMFFEQLFIVNNYTIRDKVIPKYDLVIGNPPYGAVGGRYMGMGEKSYTKAANYIDYFILRGIDLLNPGGLLIYVIGAEVAAGGRLFLDQGPSKVKEMIEARADLIDAYRLPSGVFERTEVASDIVVFRKKEK